MRNQINALFPKTRTDILNATVMHPERWWYMSDLASYLHVSPSSLQRELASLVRAGILLRRKDGNRAYFQPDPQCPFLPELQRLFLKTTGLVDVLRRALKPLSQQINVAFVYGSVARGEELSTSDVDLMVIGVISLSDIAPLLRQVEKQIKRAVNPTVYSQEEFAKHLKKKNHFLREVLTQKKLFIVGEQGELETITR